MAITLDGNNLTTTGVINSGTAQNSTSGTSIDFLNIPSGTKRITVMFNGVSLSGTSSILVQIGAGSVTTTGYVAGSAGTNNTAVTSTAGFTVVTAGAVNTALGTLTLNLVGSNLWVSSHSIFIGNTTVSAVGGGTVTLSGTLDRVRITTVNGTDTFDAGSINILYE